MFSSKVFMVLALRFRPLVHFELNFVSRVKQGIPLHSFACGNPVVLITPFLLLLLLLFLLLLLLLLTYVRSSR